MVAWRNVSQANTAKETSTRENQSVWIDASRNSSKLTSKYPRKWVNYKARQVQAQAQVPAQGSECEEWSFTLIKLDYCCNSPVPAHFETTGSFGFSLPVDVVRRERGEGGLFRWIPCTLFVFVGRSFAGSNIYASDPVSGMDGEKNTFEFCSIYLALEIIDGGDIQWGIIIKLYGTCVFYKGTWNTRKGLFYYSISSRWARELKSWNPHVSHEVPDFFSSASIRFCTRSSTLTIWRS